MLYVLECGGCCVLRVWGCCVLKCGVAVYLSVGYCVLECGGAVYLSGGAVYSSVAVLCT